MTTSVNGLRLHTLKELKQVLTDIHTTNACVIMSNNCNYSGLASTESWGKPACEMCGKFMKQEDYDYCDICGDCLDENNYI